ncbi:hypothetical protein U875_25750 [Pandoraea pnomenusa 3kgm]|uniref:hypothetical protein n=1 Tax=Pandoraea pnomenusa TaxID=93220 RepID=UPI000426E4CB|nr:hypothetical protein [Pandoraea pnomenusa]AIM43956.1 hypothetical protein U875_25750 [Pandoraea pnomenusa 3kgm]
MTESSPIVSFQGHDFAATSIRRGEAYHACLVVAGPLFSGHFAPINSTPFATEAEAIAYAERWARDEISARQQSAPERHFRKLMALIGKAAAFR